MGEDEAGGGFGRDARKIETIPGGDRRSENTGLGAQRRGCVVTDTEAISVMRPACVLFTSHQS